MEDNDLKKLKALTDSIDKEIGKGSFFRIGDKPRTGIELISSGSMNMDLALGGGYPKGRIIEFIGQESSGKTSCALMVCAESQKNGGRIGFIDAEHALSLEYAEQLGLNVEDLFINQPDNGEQGLEILDKAVSSGLFDVIVIDSVASLTPKSEIDGEMGDSKMGLHARLMGQAMRKLVAKVNKSDTLIIFINQYRDKIGVTFGDPRTTTGGNALKFYASVRCEISKIGSIKDTDGRQLGHKMKMKVIKNKIAPPFKVAETDFKYGTGVEYEAEVLDFAVSNDIVKKAGSWFSYGDTKLGQGREAVVNTLKDNPDLVQELFDKITNV